jgi:hypothetical protein
MVGSGSGIKHPGSASLAKTFAFFRFFNSSSALVKNVLKKIFLEI